MDNEITLNDLSDLLVRVGKKKHGLDCAHPFALGTIVGLLEHYIKFNYGPEHMKRAITERFELATKELS